MSDRLEDLGVPAKLLAAIRNEVRSNTEQQLNDLWMVVHSLKDSSAKSAPAEPAGPNPEVEQLKAQLSELQGDVQKKLRNLRKWVEGQSTERAAVPEDLTSQLESLRSMAERLDRVERESGQFGVAGALFESRLVDQENRLVRRIEEAEARGSGRPAAGGRAEAVDELSTEYLLGLSGSVEFSLADLAKVAIKYNASDLIVRPNSLPYTYLEGDLIPIGQKTLSAVDSHRVAMLALQPNERRQLVERRAYSKLVEYHSARFLLNAYYERGELAVYARRLVPPKLNLDRLELPRAIEVSLLEERGLILVCGNSTSSLRELAYALLQPINQQRRARIFTLEEAVTFELTEDQSLLSQLQLGHDMDDAQGLLRLRPDVLYMQRIGSLQDLHVACQLASDSTLVIAGCVGSSVVGAVQNAMELAPAETRPAVLHQLASCLRSVLCYRHPQASEHLINSAKVRPSLERGDFSALQTAVEGTQAGKSRGLDSVAAMPAVREAEPLPPPSSESFASITADSPPPPVTEPATPRPVVPQVTPPSTTKPSAANAPPPATENEKGNGGDEETLLGWL
jgi:twitching motility protein PilT